MSNSLINNTYGNIKCLSDIIFISPIQVSELPDDMIITFTINGKNYNTTKNQHDYVKIEEHFNTPEKQVVEVKYPNWTNIIQLNYNVTENT